MTVNSLTGQPEGGIRSHVATTTLEEFRMIIKKNSNQLPEMLYYKSQTDRLRNIAQFAQGLRLGTRSSGGHDQKLIRETY
jgi:hypothetical protein